MGPAAAPAQPDRYPAPPPQPSDAFWLAASRHIPIEAEVLRAGLHTIEVACAGPRYAALHVAFAEKNLAPLFVPLEVAAPRRYRKTFSLIGQAREAWIELAPSSGPGDLLSIGVKPARWRDLAALGWRA